MQLKDKLAESALSAKKLRNLITFFILTHVVFLFFGEWAVAREIPAVMAMRVEQIKVIQDLFYLKPLTGVLADSLILKIIYTFLFNLVFGALISTTATGLLFFLPYVIAVWRSFLIGVLIYGMDLTPTMLGVFYGTFILEFGAYSLSSAVGADIGLSMLFPGRKGVLSRWEAFKISVKNGRDVYILIAIILFVSALWEIGWIHQLGPLIKPELLK